MAHLPVGGEVRFIYEEDLYGYSLATNSLTAFQQLTQLKPAAYGVACTAP